MRRLRVLCILFFILSVLVACLYGWKKYDNHDVNGPEITMAEESVTVSVTADDAAILNGVTAYDDKDGDVTDSLIIENMSNFVETGRRTVTIAAFDSQNNVSKITREIVYSDYKPAQFSFEAPLKFAKNVDSILVGVGATDCIDGNLTSKIKVVSDNYISVDKEGEYQVILSVTNSAGAVTQLPVTLEIYDAQDESRKPQIELSKYIVYTKKGTQLNLWDYVQKISVGTTEYVRGEDGILRSVEDTGIEYNAENVAIAQQIDYKTPGVYEVVYRVAAEDREPGSVRLVVVVTE